MAVKRVWKESFKYRKCALSRPGFKYKDTSKMDLIYTPIRDL